MIGRVLRQPHTRKTGILKSFNQCYIVCMDQDVAEAVEGVRKGLQSEGMDGLAGDINLLEGRKKIRNAGKNKKKKII